MCRTAAGIYQDDFFTCRLSRKQPGYAKYPRVPEMEASALSMTPLWKRKKTRASPIIMTITMNLITFSDITWSASPFIKTSHLAMHLLLSLSHLHVSPHILSILHSLSDRSSHLVPVGPGMHVAHFATELSQKHWSPAARPHLHLFMFCTISGSSHVVTIGHLLQLVTVRVSPRAFTVMELYQQFAESWHSAGSD